MSLNQRNLSQLSHSSISQLGKLEARGSNQFLQKKSDLGFESSDLTRSSSQFLQKKITWDLSLVTWLQRPKSVPAEKMTWVLSLASLVRLKSVSSEKNYLRFESGDLTTEAQVSSCRKNDLSFESSSLTRGSSQLLQKKVTWILNLVTWLQRLRSVPAEKKNDLSTASLLSTHNCLALYSYSRSWLTSSWDK